MTAAVKENDPLLPPLRPDLELFPGPSEADGSPTYSLYDPLSGVYHKIGWAEAAVLRHLRAPRLLSDVLATVRKSLTVELSREDILGLCQDAARNGLTVSSCVRDVPDLMRERAMRKMHPLKWVAQHYLYFRLPLIYPARFLARALPCARLLASRPMLALYLALSVMGVLFLAEKPERYLATFPHFLSVEGAAWYGIAVAGIKIIHEFSHAFMASALGVRVRSMGVAFMVFWPIPFCDVTDGWRLPKRRDRAIISTAGIMAEAVIAGLALFLWGMTKPGVAHSIFFIISSAGLLSTLIVNLNPAMRFDGYYILTDLWGIDNLQQRAFAMTKWRLRKTFLGLDDPPPEHGVRRRRLAGMIAYSVYTWIYRVGLYLGIAVLVYYKFAKVVGLILFSLEVFWFLVMPVVREGRYLAAVRERLKINPRLIATIVALAALLGWAALPLPRRVGLPAIAVPAASQIIYAPSAGRVTDLAVERGAHVKSGQPILRIHSEERLARMEILRLEIRRLRHQAASLAEDENARALLPQKQEEIARAEAQTHELRQIEDLNHVTAGFAGTVSDWSPAIREGRFVQGNSILGRIISPEKPYIVGYVPEYYLDDLAPGKEVEFIAADRPDPFPARIRMVEPVRSRRLEYVSLSTQADGPIAVVQGEGNRMQMVDSYYRFEADLSEDNPHLRLGQKGRIWLRTPPRSLAVEGIRQVINTLLRESNF